MWTKFQTLLFPQPLSHTGDLKPKCSDPSNSTEEIEKDPGSYF